MVTGYSDFEREPDGSVTAVAHRTDGSSERVGVRVSVERKIERDGRVIADGEVASSDVPAGEAGYVQLPAGVRS